MLCIHGRPAILLVQGRRDLNVLPTFLQYYYITVIWIQGLTAMLLVQGRGEMVVLLAITSVMFHNNFVGTWAYCGVVNTG